VVEVVVLDRLRHTVDCELVAQLREARREVPQPANLLPPERQIQLQELLVAGGEDRKPEIGDAVGGCSRA
jgi:hypothetical protein